MTNLTTIDRRRHRGILAGAVLSLALVACGGDAEAGSSDAGDGGESEEFSRVINVETHTVEPREFTEMIRLTGTVQANRDVTVAAEENGVIREVFAEKGTSVTPGQPIVKIDDKLLESQVDEARAQAELARETWERRKRLYEEDDIGSELAYLEARYAADQARARLETLEERLARTVIRAPIGGVLEDRFVEVGTMVSPGAAVARILDLDPVKITAGMPERYAADVERGAEATVTFGVLDDEVFEGRISYVGSAVNPENRTFPVEFTLPNPNRAIKPEMVADLSVVRRQLDDALVIPQEALVRVENGYVAFVAVTDDEGSVAESRELTLGPSQRNRVVVLNGLEAGDRVVVVGQQQVAEGDRVRVVGER